MGAGLVPITVFIGGKRDCDLSSSWLRRTNRYFFVSPQIAAQKRDTI